MQIEGYKRGFRVQVLVARPHSFSNLCLKLFFDRTCVCIQCFGGYWSLVSMNFSANLKPQPQVTCIKWEDCLRIPVSMHVGKALVEHDPTGSHTGLLHMMTRQPSTLEWTDWAKYFRTFWILIMSILHTQSDLTAWLIWRGQNIDNSGKQNHF